MGSRSVDNNDNESLLIRPFSLQKPGRDFQMCYGEALLKILANIRNSHTPEGLLS